jgi:hypothetical protein
VIDLPTTDTKRNKKEKEMIKIWDVTVGNGYSRETVIAKNYIEAGRKAIKKSSPILREEKFISSVKLARTVEM